MNLASIQRTAERRLFQLLIVGLMLWGAVELLGAFGRYIKQSQTNHVEGMFKKMADGATEHMAEHCEFPESVVLHDRIPVGGEKITPPEMDQSLLQPFYLTGPMDPTYYAYSARQFMDGNAMRIEARADFVPGGPHTVNYTYLERTGPCRAEVVEFVVRAAGD